MATRGPRSSSAYVKRYSGWTDAGLVALMAGVPRDQAARMDDETHDRWDAAQAAAEADLAAERAATEERRQRQREEHARREAAAEQLANKRDLDFAEQRLRVNDRIRRLKRRKDADLTDDGDDA